MYAIVQQGGHQYRVEPGDRLLVDQLDASVGSVVGLEPVLALQGDDGVTVGTPTVAGARVAATVVGHRLGAKLRVFKYKPKKRFRRTMGHRTHYTELRIEAVVPAGQDLPEPAAPAVAEAPAPPAETVAAGPSAPGETAAKPRRAPRAKAQAAPAGPADSAAPAVDEAAGAASAGEERSAARSRRRPKAETGGTEGSGRPGSEQES